ncbi:myb domain protein 4r1 [Zea mays]|nr:myb domain protein 4r1 [Zea mays]
MDWYSDDSDPDIDEDLREDLDALRRSCILSGADPDAAVAQVSSGLAGPSTPALAAAPGAAADHHHHASSSDDEEDEDLALVRSIRANLHHLHNSKASTVLPDAAPAPRDDDDPSSRPICTWPPSDTDEEEDDLETLRAIQRRFSHYQSSTSTASPKTMKPEASQGVHSDLFADRSGDDFAVQKQNAIVPHGDGFPKAALLLVDALKKNRAYQKFIRRKMVNIEAKIEENKDLRDRVKCLLGYQLSCRKSVSRSLGQKEDPRVRLISPLKSTQPCTKNKYRKIPALFLGPAENPHVSKYEMALKQFPMSFKKQPWSDAEKDKLARGIKQQYQETLILDSLNNGSADGDFSALDMAYALTNGAGNFEVTPENLRSVLPLINWDKISAMYLPGRSGAECESRWLNCDDPLINHEAWTADEETRLLLIIQEKGMCNWIDIAVTLGTYRTPFQCLVRYQRSLNPHILNKAWTKEEDLQLQAAVETFGQKWQLVSASLDGRTGTQCSNRWRKTLHPEKTSVGRWLLDEDKRLMVTVKLIGPGRWSLIAPFIPGRTQTQIFERWCNILDPDLYLDDWRPDEDSTLLAAVSEFGPCWSKISKTIIPGRNDSMCYRRWRKLCKHEVQKAREARQLKKAIFQNNFVDREKERPAICPRDLISLLPSKGDGCDVAIVRGGSEKQGEENHLALSNIVNISSGLDCVAANSVLNASSRRPRRVSSGRRSKKHTEGNNIAAPDDLNASSSAPSSSIKRKSTTGNNVAAKKRSRVSISVNADNEVEKNRITDSVAVSEEGLVKKRTRRPKPVGNEGAVRKRGGSNNEVGTNIITESVAVGEEGVVKKRTRRSKPVGNEGADNEVGTYRITGSVVVGEEGVVKKRTRRSSKPVDNEEVVRKMRGSINNYDEAGTNTMMNSAFGEEEVVKKKTRHSKPVGTEGAASIGGDGMVNKRRTGSVSTENLGAVRKRKIVSSRRKLAEVNLPTEEGVPNAVPDLDFPCAISEERAVDVGNMDKGRRKSTPRPKQINMPEEDADKNSTFTRLKPSLEKGLVSPVMMVLRVEVAVSTRGMPKG